MRKALRAATEANRRPSHRYEQLRRKLTRNIDDVWEFTQTRLGQVLNATQELDTFLGDIYDYKR